MENTKAEPITADSEPNVEREDVKVSEEVLFEDVSTKWKWVWRDICFVAEAVSEGQEEPKSGEEVSIKAEQGNTGDIKVVPTVSGVKRKVGITGVETDETAKKTAKLSNDLAAAAEKMEIQ